MKIELGKIMHVRFGSGGYQNSQFGIWFQLGNDVWGVGDGKGSWSGNPSSHDKWTIEDKIKQQGDIMIWIEELMKQAKVSEINKLIGIPIEITFDSPYGKMLSWRILTEVL